jgi:hypothetical protein
MEVEDDSPRNDGYPNFPGRESDAARFQVLHDSRGSVQAESAPSTQEDRMHALHHMTGKAGTQIACSRSGASNIHSADRAPFAEDNSAPCQPFEVTRVSDADAWNCFICFRFLGPDQRVRPSLRESFRESCQTCLRVVLI